MPNNFILKSRLDPQIRLLSVRMKPEFAYCSVITRGSGTSSACCESLPSQTVFPLWGRSLNICPFWPIGCPAAGLVFTPLIICLSFFIIIFFPYPDSSAAEHNDVFGLNGQVEHKLAFIRTHVPKEPHLILVGHSIGCYIILEMMKRSPELKVCMLLNAG